jgi:hypothetical protein
MVATSGKPNAWYVNQELRCLWRTKVLLTFQPKWDPLFQPKLEAAFAADMSSSFMVYKWEMSSFPTIDIW